MREKINTIRKKYNYSTSQTTEEHPDSEWLVNILDNAIKNSEVGVLEYLLLPKEKWIRLKKDKLKDNELKELDGLDDETRDTLFQDYVNKHIKRSFIQSLEDQLLLSTYEQYAEQEKEEVQVNEEKNRQRETALKIIKFAARDQQRRDQTRYIAKSVASVAGVIIVSSIGIVACAILAPFLIPMGAAAGAVVGGLSAWVGFGKLIGAGTAKVSAERLAMAPGADWGAIIGFTVGVALSAVLGVVIPGAGAFLGIAAGYYLGGAAGALIGAAIGCVGSYQIAKKIKHTTSKVVTNIATALGSIVGGFVGAAIGTVLFPGIGTAAGMAIGAAAGGSLFGAGTFLKLRKEKEVNKELDASRKMAAAGGIVGACAGSSIGAAIGTAIFPGIGTIVGAAIGAVVGMLGIGGLSYKAAQSHKSKIQVMMGITGAIGGGKIGGMFGAGIGGTLGGLLFGPAGLFVGAGLGMAIGTLIGAIAAGSYRVFFGRFAKKTEEPKKPENDAVHSTTPENVVHLTDTRHPTPQTPVKKEDDALNNIESHFLHSNKSHDTLPDTKQNKSSSNKFPSNKSPHP